MDWVAANRMLSRSKSPLGHESGAAFYTRSEPQIRPGARRSGLAGENLRRLTIGLIDSDCLSRECLREALRNLRPEIHISDFMTVGDCTASAPQHFDIIMYYAHGDDISGKTIAQIISVICKKFPGTPVIIFSDTNRMRQATIMRTILESGARGFVPTRTTGLLIIAAAINLVSAGGTFVPADLLLTTRPDSGQGRLNRLTLQQRSVLGHLRQGKANKIIAHELGMSESTVKVQIRNIMRKMGANNRTHAVYKAHRNSNDLARPIHGSEVCFACDRRPREGEAPVSSRFQIRYGRR
jgi:DNA-binding NarL/FixJ family response regulator